LLSFSFFVVVPTCCQGRKHKNKIKQKTITKTRRGDCFLLFRQHTWLLAACYWKRPRSRHQNNNFFSKLASNKNYLKYFENILCS
jgi:hypothetical protein